jgi:CRP/FNR family transcriptional regulator, transcriptional activator FtrB
MQINTLTVGLGDHVASQQRSSVMTKTRIDPNLLRSTLLFGSASEEHLHKLAAAASLRTAASRTILFAEGSRVENLFILTRGAAELFSERDERRFTISVVRGARPLSLPSLLAERHPLSARILEPSELLAVPAKLLVELVGRDAGFADAMVRELATESLQIIEDFKNHRLLNTTARIAHWMLHWDRESGGSGQIVIPFDKRVLASYLGMTPEQLSRGFSTLVAAGVTVDGRSVTIASRAALTKVARREEN